VAEAVTLIKEKGLHALIVERRHDQDYGIVTETTLYIRWLLLGKIPERYGSKL